MVATIAEHVGLNPHRWITVRAHQLVVGDQVRTAGWSRTITAIHPPIDDLYVVFEWILSHDPPEFACGGAPQSEGSVSRSSHPRATLNPKRKRQHTMTTLSPEAPAKAREYEANLQAKAEKEAKAKADRDAAAARKTMLASPPVGARSKQYPGHRGHDSVGQVIAMCDEYGITLKVGGDRLIVGQPVATRVKHKAEAVGQMIDRQRPLFSELLKGKKPKCDMCSTQAITVRVGPTLVCEKHAG